MHKPKLLSVQRLALLVLLALCQLSCSRDAKRMELPVLDALGGDFTLQSTLDRPLALSELQGKVVLLNFGFTHCPDVCPTVLNRLAGINRKLGEQYSRGDTVQTLFITVDPERDSLAHLKEYLPFFDKSFIGLTGDLSAITTVAKQYAVYFEKQGDGENYTVSHSDKIFLLDRQGRLRALFGSQDPDELIIASIMSLMSGNDISAR